MRYTRGWKLTSRSAALALGASLFLGGCATFGGVRTPEVARVHIHNESWAPVDVSAVIDGRPRAVGRVHPDGYPYFDMRLPEGGASELIVVVRSDRDGELRTDPIDVSSGALVLVRLDRDWSRSRWWIR